MVCLVRHAHAGDKHQWTGDDRDRPLSVPGHHEAYGLLARLRDYPIGRILTSPAVRCVQTVEPLGQRRAGRAGRCAGGRRPGRKPLGAGDRSGVGDRRAVRARRADRGAGPRVGRWRAGGGGAAGLGQGVHLAPGHQPGSGGWRQVTAAAAAQGPRRPPLGIACLSPRKAGWSRIAPGTSPTARRRRWSWRGSTSSSARRPRSTGSTWWCPGVVLRAGRAQRRRQDHHPVDGRRAAAAKQLLGVLPDSLALPERLTGR
jgi:hypothetical protein